MTDILSVGFQKMYNVAEFTHSIYIKLILVHSEHNFSHVQSKFNISDDYKNIMDQIVALWYIKIQGQQT